MASRLIRFDFFTFSMTHLDMSNRSVLVLSGRHCYTWPCGRHLRFFDRIVKAFESPRVRFREIELFEIRFNQSRKSLINEFAQSGMACDFAS